MASTLNNVAAPAEYTEAATLNGGPGILAEAFVYNNAAIIQIAQSLTGEAGLAVWGPEIFVAPQQATFLRRGIFAIRARSAVPAEPARVTLTLVALEEHPVSFTVDQLAELAMIRREIAELHGKMDLGQLRTPL